MAARRSSDLPTSHEAANFVGRRRVPVAPTAQRSLVPDDVTALPAVFVKTPTGHPYLYRRRISRFDSSARPGDLVVVRLDRTTVLGYGIFNPRAEITVRMVRWGSVPPDDAFWQEQCAQAAALRRDLLRLDSVTDAYRVLHSEGDGVSGIVVDKFADVLSAEAFGLGMFSAGPICSALVALCDARSWILRLRAGHARPGRLRGRTAPVVRDTVRRNGPRIWHAVPRPVRRGA